MCNTHRRNLYCNYNTHCVLKSTIHTVYCNYSKDFVYVKHDTVMHQSFATTSPSGPGNSGDIDFSLSKARVYARHCRDTLMVKALPKSLLKSQQVNVNFHGHIGTGIKTPAIPRHCRDNAEVKTLQLSPAIPPLFPAPRGPWLRSSVIECPTLGQDDV